MFSLLQDLSFSFNHKLEMHLLIKLLSIIAANWRVYVIDISTGIGHKHLKRTTFQQK
jgi:hypothetical protein